MRIDLSDLDRLEGIAAALERLFWCLIAVAFFAAVLGSAGTGLLVLILAATSFVARAGLEDFVRAHRDAGEPRIGTERPGKTAPSAKPAPTAEPEFTTYRVSRRRRTKSPV